MNNTLREYAKSEIISGLEKLPESWVKKFKMMYSHNDLDASISDIIDKMPDEKLDWAMQQIYNSINKLDSA